MAPCNYVQWQTGPYWVAFRYRTCDNGKPSSKKDKCAQCDVAGNDTYVFIEPEVSAAAPNPFGEPPAAAAAAPNPFGKPQATAAKAPADDSGGENPFGGQVRQNAENPFNYASVGPGEGDDGPVPQSPKSPTIQYAKLELASKPEGGAAAPYIPNQPQQQGDAVEDDNALYGTATTFSA